MTHPQEYLEKLGLGDSEITIYLRMVAGAKTARDILKTTKMKRPTVYYGLNLLEKRGLIFKSEKNDDNTFSLAPFERLIAIAKEKEDEATSLTEQIGELVLGFSTSQKELIEKPEVSFFEGVDAVKHVVMDVMYAKSKKVDLIVPEKTFFWGFGEDFIRKYIEERRTRNIRTRNLWEVEIEKKDYKQYYSSFSSTRILPKSMHGKFKTTIFLFDNKTLYVSSLGNSYAILVNSKEHNETLSALFDGIWEIAVPHKE